jgi:hypothetical protein
MKISSGPAGGCRSAPPFRVTIAERTRYGLL